VYLKDFIEDDQASYAELALELMDLDNHAIEDLFATICLHSDLTELEDYGATVEMAIHQYDNTANYRRDAGRGD